MILSHHWYVPSSEVGAFVGEGVGAGVAGVGAGVGAWVPKQKSHETWHFSLIVAPLSQYPVQYSLTLKASVSFFELFRIQSQPCCLSLVFCPNWNKGSSSQHVPQVWGHAVLVSDVLQRLYLGPLLLYILSLLHVYVLLNQTAEYVSSFTHVAWVVPTAAANSTQRDSLETNMMEQWIKISLDDLNCTREIVCSRNCLSWSLL